jgi:glycosyltransferase involved in cell wall biosynthesis
MMPAVTGLLLTNGTRDEMTRRAIRCFHAQTYPRKHLLLVDSGQPSGDWVSSDIAATIFRCSAEPIGVLRNLGCQVSRDDIIAHFDDDDWSHPRRLQEQIDFLIASGAPIVGYRDMLIRDERPKPPVTWRFRGGSPGAALGSSLCYWRESWLNRPFPRLHTGEDTTWQLRFTVQTMSSLEQEPRMVATVHGQNTGLEIAPGFKEWSKAPQWDHYAAEVLKS